MTQATTARLKAAQDADFAYLRGGTPDSKTVAALRVKLAKALDAAKPKR